MQKSRLAIQIEAREKLAPEVVNEIHNSNLILNMLGKIKEVIDYLKMYENEHEAINKAIEKLGEI